MDTYDKIDTEKYVIDIVNLIHIILQLHDNANQYIIAALETDKQVYLFYHAP